MCDASGSWSGFHCRKLGLNITYRRSESFQCILKACRPHELFIRTYWLLIVKRDEARNARALFVPPDARPSSKLKRRAGRKHVLPSSFT